MTESALDYIIIGIILMVFGFFFYRALHEPLDLLFGWIKEGLLWLGDKINGATEKVEVIHYD